MRYKQLTANPGNALESNRAELMKPIRDKIQTAINSVGKEKGYTYVLDLATGAAVFVADDAINATNDVKAKLGIK